MTVTRGALLGLGIASASCFALGAWFLFEVGRSLRELINL